MTETIIQDWSGVLAAPDINTSVLALTIVSATDAFSGVVLPSGACSFRMRITDDVHEEWVHVTSRSGTALTLGARHDEGETPRSWTAGARLEAVLTSNGLLELHSNPEADALQYVSTGGDAGASGRSAGQAVASLQQAVTNTDDAAGGGNVVAGTGTYTLDDTTGPLWISSGTIARLAGMAPNGGAIIEWAGTVPPQDVTLASDWRTGTSITLSTDGGDELKAYLTDGTSPFDGGLQGYAGGSNKVWLYIAPNDGGGLSYLGEYIRATISGDTVTVLTREWQYGLCDHVTGAIITVVQPIVALGANAQSGGFSRSGLERVRIQCADGHNGWGMVGMWGKGVNNLAWCRFIQVGDGGDPFGSLNPANGGFLLTGNPSGSTNPAFFDTEAAWDVGGVRGFTIVSTGGQGNMWKWIKTDGDIRTRAHFVSSGVSAIGNDTVLSSNIENHGAPIAGHIKCAEAGLGVVGGLLRGTEQFSTTLSVLQITTADGGAGGSMADSATGYLYAIVYKGGLGIGTLPDTDTAGAHAKTSNNPCTVGSGKHIASGKKVTVTLPSDPNVVPSFETYDLIRQDLSGEPGTWRLVATVTPSGTSSTDYLDSAANASLAVYTPRTYGPTAQSPGLVGDTPTISTGTPTILHDTGTVFTVGQWVRVAGAGTGGADLFAKVATGGTGSCTLDRSCSTTVNAAVIDLGYFFWGSAEELSTMTKNDAQMTKGRLTVLALECLGYENAYEGPFTPTQVTTVKPGSPQQSYWLNAIPNQATL